MALVMGGTGEKRGSAVLDGSAAARAAARLSRSGIPCRLGARPDPAGGYAARYTVRVRELTAEWIKHDQIGGGSTRHEPEHDSGRYADGLHRRLEKAAVRSLYTLGAEEGEVVIAARPGRRYVVEELRFQGSPGRAVMSAKADPAGRGSRLSPGGAEAGAGASAGAGPGAGNLLLGMDPEFILMRDNGEVVHASAFMERGGLAGSDAVRFRGEVIYPLAELRPDPKPQPKELLRELQRAMREAYALITDRTLSWRAGALPYTDFPLGGHIHFSGVPLTLSLLQVLDNYLALPLALLEDPQGRVRRPRYGFLGDFRRQSYGGFEYRTLPSFLISPFVTKLSLAIAYLAAKYSDLMPARPLNAERYHRAYYEGDKAALRECVPGWHRDLSALPEYPRFACEIEKALSYIESGRTWDESRDIRPLWNIPSMP
ncbi:putative amidoligase domain-containing protein [Paenibacillus ihbetae]|uniref:Phage phiEco32-like COOH-NH2 ligase-type 2 n=1 Tax=Paenibacillus ihbetae TaxID=1870820 RepID=A0ABX3JTH7_9BACL|nr:hypothetical protein [Paenibacillus ihbetae]OOC60984.1 hypothetical protein BBD40_03220 [Paenibacillus ihbetae]